MLKSLSELIAYVIGMGIGTDNRDCNKGCINNVIITLTVT